MQRFDRLRYIQQLDPIHDCNEICQLMTGYEFPWDITRALEVALLRTFCVPSIGKLLDGTGEFHHRPQKRYDDTALLIASFFKWGYDSPQGKAAIDRMNRIHGHFPIFNGDYLYVLSTFVVEPVRWIDRFGWRKLSEVEKQALFYFWYNVGQQMGLQEIPTDYATLEQYNREYEQQYFDYSPATQRVGETTVNLFLSWFPPMVRSSLKPWIYAMLDDPLLKAFGFPAPRPWQRQVLNCLLQMRGQLFRYFPPRSQPNFYVDSPQRSYPHGYTIEDLGPPGMLDQLNKG